MDAWAEQVRGRVSDLLLSQGKAVASAYVAGLPVESALSLTEWEGLLKAVHTAVIEAEGKVAYNDLLKTIIARGDGGTFDVLADGVTEWIDQHVGDAIKYIDETTKTLLRGEIAAGVEAGESVPNISKRLRALSEEWSGYRAERIARTEVANSFGAAHDLSARQMAESFGLTFTKRWSSASDARVRPEHVELNSEVVGLDETFSDGSMTAPSGVNCRCATLYGEAG